MTNWPNSAGPRIGNESGATGNGDGSNRASRRERNGWRRIQLPGIKRRAYYKRLKKYGSVDGAQVASVMKLKQHRTQPVHQSKRHVSRAVQATSRPRLNINRKGRSNRTAESVAADATNRPRVLR